MTTLRRRAERISDGPDSVRQYLNEIGSVPLLTAAEEVELGKRIEAGVYAGELLRRADAGTGDPVVNRAELDAVARDGARAKEHLIRANLRLVVAAGRKRRNSGVPLLDLIQEGNLGLIRAVEKFDYTKGYKFSTYAMFWIRQAMQRGTALASRTIRLPQHVFEELAKLDRAERELMLRLQHDPTVAELAEESGLSVERVAELRRIARATVSLDSPVGDDGDTTLGDLIGEAGSPQASDESERSAAAEQLNALLDTLPTLERKVISFPYGLSGGRPSTFQEIADQLGLSREHVRVLERRALARLRDPELRQSQLALAG